MLPEGRAIVVALSVRPYVRPFTISIFHFADVLFVVSQNIMASLKHFWMSKIKKRALMNSGFLSLSPQHRPDITEILLKRTPNPVIHPSIH